MTNVSIDLYEKREKIQPHMVKGFFQTIRNYTIYITLAVFFIIPWLNFNGRQAVLFDLNARKFHVFHITFWPQDFFLLSWLLIISAISLFLVTAVAGRVWCGYYCPQTVWTRLFLYIETLCEGNRSKRLKLDKAKISIVKIFRRGIKHIFWLLLANVTALTFVGYFVPIHKLINEFFLLASSYWETFWVIFFTLATYINAGMMREQVCKYMCPYARFQSVMFDKDTLIITYDYKRGEPRGSRKRHLKSEDRVLGDCINCLQCVHACPTGIDIRDGLQMECIGCAACIDACNAVMDKMNYPRNLVKYSTERVIESNQKSKILRPRVVAYGIVLAIMMLLSLLVLTHRNLLKVDIIRDRNQLYRLVAHNQVENVYQIRLMNKAQAANNFNINIVESEKFQYLGPQVVALHAGEIKTVIAKIRTQKSRSKIKSLPLTIKVTSEDGTITYQEDARFLQP